MVLVHCVGDVTGETWDGKFRVKVALSHGDHLDQDRIRRELLGDARGIPSVRAERTAEFISQCVVRIMEAPSWWTGSTDATGYPGRAFEDDNLLSEIFSAVMSVDIRVKRALDEMAKQAQEELKTATP